MVKPGNTADIPQHFKIGKGYDDLGLGYAALLFSIVIARNPVGILDEQPGIADGRPVSFRTEAIGCAAIDAVCAESAIVIIFHRTVTDIVTETLRQVSEGLKDIDSQLVVYGSRNTVRKGEICPVEDFLGLSRR